MVGCCYVYFVLSISSTTGLSLALELAVGLGVTGFRAKNLLGPTCAKHLRTCHTLHTAQLQSFPKICLNHSNPSESQNMSLQKMKLAKLSSSTSILLNFSHHMKSNLGRKHQESSTPNPKIYMIRVFWLFFPPFSTFFPSKPETSPLR